MVDWGHKACFRGLKWIAAAAIQLDAKHTPLVWRVWWACNICQEHVHLCFVCDPALNTWGRAFLQQRHFSHQPGFLCCHPNFFAVRKKREAREEAREKKGEGGKRERKEWEKEGRRKEGRRQSRREMKARRACSLCGALKLVCLSNTFLFRKSNQHQFANHSLKHRLQLAKPALLFFVLLFSSVFSGH